MNEAKYIPALRYNWLTNFYDTIVKTTMPEEKFKVALLHEARIRAGQSVLDFGVGTGTLSILAKYKHPEAEFTGVDLDDKALMIAKRKIEQDGLSISLIKYDGVTLPFADNSFDKVISSLVFHHLLPQEKLNSLGEIHRVLKDGGELHIVDWGKASNIFMRGVFYLVQILDGFENTSDHVDNRFPNFIKQAGFEDVEVGRSLNTVFGTLQLFKAKKGFKKPHTFVSR